MVWPKVIPLNIFRCKTKTKYKKLILAAVFLLEKPFLIIEKLHTQRKCVIALLKVKTWDFPIKLSQHVFQFICI
jgi:hypothetical protein